MPEGPALLFAVVGAACLVAYFAVRIWWRGVKLSLGIIAAVLIVLAVLVYLRM